MGLTPSQTLAEQVYFISKHAEFSTEGIDQIESLLLEAMEEAIRSNCKCTDRVVCALHEFMFKQIRQETFEEAAKVAESFNDLEEDVAVAIRAFAKELK